MMAPAIAERRGRRKEGSEGGKERKGGERQNRNRTERESRGGTRTAAPRRVDHHRLIYNAGGVTEFTIKIPRSAALMDRRVPRNAGDDSGIFK